MTPSGNPWRRAAVLARRLGAIFLLDAALTFENVWPTPAIRWAGGLSTELAVCLLLLAALGARSTRRWLAAALAALWIVLAAGRYAEVTAPALYGRDINLYWDLRFIPDVGAMTEQQPRAWLAASAGLASILFLAQSLNPQSAIRNPQSAIFPSPVIRTYAHQLALVREARAGSRSIPPSPDMSSDLARVEGADVFVVFIESYGAVAYQDGIGSALAAARARLDADIRQTGRTAVSAFVESPTFGGSSWLAHISLLSGIEIRDPDSNALLMTQRRPTLVQAFSRRGFRTVGLMPGLRQQWPEGAFYGFDQIYGADALGYAGPEFGWFAIPDQFSLLRLDLLESSRPAGPRFVFFPTISTHFPFSPTPPYQPAWNRMLDPKPYDGPAVVRAYAAQPNWTDFGPGYIDAVSYDLAVLGGYLRRHADRDLVMILIGDHQPPAAVSGEHATWNVPVHIVTSRPAIAAGFEAHGFREGLIPAAPAVARMHSLLPILLDVFGDHE
jgi:hypothetical protein